MILVTNCTVNIGSRLMSNLDNVICIARPDSFSGNTVEGVEYIEADLMDSVKTRELLQKVKPELVIDLASKTPVKYNYNDTSYMDNAIIVYNISMAYAPIIHASTADVYPYTPYPHYYKEIHYDGHPISSR